MSVWLHTALSMAIFVAAAAWARSRTTSRPSLWDCFIQVFAWRLPLPEKADFAANLTTARVWAWSLFMAYVLVIYVLKRAGVPVITSP